MSKPLQGRHFITTQEWSTSELELALQTSWDLKRKFYRDEPHALLRDKTLFMLFFEQSTRTRNSFEAGMTQLGGHAHDLAPGKLQISHGETAEDTARVFSRMGHGITIRNCDWGLGNSFIRKVAGMSRVPVINAQCDLYHPCQALADLMTIREKFQGDLRGRKITVSWTYAPSYVRPISVPHSEILLMTRFGLDVTLAHPPEFKLQPEIMAQAEANAVAAGGKFATTDNMDDAFEGAHIVYPKSWGCLVHEPDREAAVKHIEKYPDWICDERRMGLASPEAIYMHPLPATRGQEVTDAVIDGPQSVVWDQAENRLHTAKGLMALTM
ncbi:ornithine carbamoyltransferase [bacterium CG17_big_fil_post_rev_8_21_14_2_50_64_8]|nr:MAG: ornithine carbamoyltransferase [bacterium CG17_big_fil_post_rev_8_21_14_2_50_64_8]PJA73923.1 MAG: ornithine carbamoyltransferase [bacterium CG_4_9_14_3_um_filter_65_15]